jgi:LysM repeat protein
LLSNIEELKDSLAAQQKRMGELVKEVQRLDEDTTHAHAKYATREDLNSLVDKIREVDRKREEDQKLVLKEVEKLAKLRAAPVLVEPPQESIKPAESGKGFEYRVKSGDNFGVIVKKFNDKIKAEGGRGQVTVDQLAKANPGVNPSKLKVGQKIFVPEPTQ